jgi:hypothetical protein
MRIDSFTFEPEQTDEFVRFGYDLYREDSNWIAPLESELRHQLSPGFDFFADPENRHRHFLATENGRVLGRVSAMLNSRLRNPEGELVGTVGFFESEPDYGVAEQLLRAALHWLAEQGRVRKVWGPMNFDIWHGYRFMTTGFDQPLFLGEPYNKRYYSEFFAAFGFQPCATWDSVEVTGRDTLERMIARGAQRHQLLRERGYRFEAFQMRHWDQEVKKLHGVLSSSFSRFPGFTHVCPVEFARLFSSGRPGLHPRLFCFVYNDRSDLVGFAGAFVDLGAAVRLMRGQEDLLAHYRFLRTRPQAHRINFYMGGITPEEEARGTGLGRAGFAYIIREALNEGYESLLLSLRLKGNSSRGLASRFAPTPQREYKLYELAL